MLIKLTEANAAKNITLVQENTRLQSKVVRLNLGGPLGDGGDASLIEEVDISFI